MRVDLMDKGIPSLKGKYYKIIIKIKYGSQQLFHDFHTKSPENLFDCLFRNSAQLILLPESSARFTELGLGYLLNGTEMVLGYFPNRTEAGLGYLSRQLPTHLGYVPIQKPRLGYYPG
jgi:hypothetical protein